MQKTRTTVATIVRTNHGLERRELRGRLRGRQNRMDHLRSSWVMVARTSTNQGFVVQAAAVSIVVAVVPQADKVIVGVAVVEHHEVVVVYASKTIKMNIWRHDKRLTI